MVTKVYGAFARAEALAAGDPKWMDCTVWPREVYSADDQSRIVEEDEFPDDIPLG